MWTFSEPPKNFFSPHAVPLLTDEKQKNDLIESLGADLLISIPFDRAVASLSAEQFMEEILATRLRAAHLVCGFNYSFGAQGAGNTERLRQFCQKNGIGITVTEPVVSEGSPVSSSLVRQAITDGNTEAATRLLGRPYSLSATVVDGQHLARNLGFPTVNQLIPEKIAVPRYGVYVSRIRGMSRPYYGITNVGTRPTVKGTLLCAETHIFGFSGNLYGTTLSVDLLTFLRPEIPFPTLEDLSQQVRKDIEDAKRYLETL